MRIIVINLERANDRRKKILAQFVEIGLECEFLVAIDGRKISDKERALVDNEKRKRITKYPLTDNEIACWLSHKNAMLSLLASNEEIVAIIEDDAILSPEFARVIGAIENANLEFDVIDLHRKFKKGEFFVPVHKLVDKFAIGRIGRSHMGAIGYIISRKGAEKFLNYAPKFAHAIDKEMRRYWANGLDIYGLEIPIVFHNDNEHSYIDETRGQECPEQRKCYPNAGKFFLQRRINKIKDSINKRIAFRMIVKDTIV